MQLGSGVDVAVPQASRCSSDLTPSLGTSICHGRGPKKTKKKIVLNKMIPGTMFSFFFFLFFWGGGIAHFSSLYLQKAIDMLPNHVSHVL